MVGPVHVSKFFAHQLGRGVWSDRVASVDRQPVFGFGNQPGLVLAGGPGGGKGTGAKYPAQAEDSSSLQHVERAEDIDLDGFNRPLFGAHHDSREMNYIADLVLLDRIE